MTGARAAPRGPPALLPSSAMRAASGGGLLEGARGWWNDTAEFWGALEIWEFTPIKEDKAPEAVALWAQVQRVQEVTRRARRGGAPGATGDLNALMEPLPKLAAAYYSMRLARVFSKKVVKRGFSNIVLWANVGIAAVFFRIVLPRLLAATSIDELSDAAGAVGIPDAETLSGMLGALNGYDFLSKLALFQLAFVLEKLTMVSEFLPIQIGLKTVAPVLFGGLLPGALISAACETLGALCNFAVGRGFLTTRLREQSIFGGPALGEAKWFAKFSRAAEEDGLRLTLLLRLAPVIPLPLDSYWYILGALPVEPAYFAAAHFLGCLKTAFLDASLGVLLLESVSLKGSELQAQAQQIAAAETVAFAVVATLVGTVASRLAGELLGLEEEEESGEEQGAAAAGAGPGQAEASNAARRAGADVVDGPGPQAPKVARPVD